ncbi:MAG: glycosyltransferase [Anaeromyxobacteraceae bacterium]
MTLALFGAWRARGLHPAVMTLYDEPDELAAELRDLGVAVYRAKIPGARLGRYPALVRETARICREARPHAFLSMPFGWHAFMAMGARAAGVPVRVAHVGSYPPHWQGRSFWKFRVEVMLGRPFTTELVCCSRYVEDGVREHFAGVHGPTSVVYNGVDIAGIAVRAAAARKARPAGGPFRVGMVARLEHSKDHDTLVDAAAAASREVDIELWLIGDGSRRGELEAKASALGLGARVRFLGSRRDVPELLGQLDAFAFSVKPDEGLGISLVEALAARVPVVATDVGGCREVLGVHAPASVVPYRDAPAMAAALVALAKKGAAPERVDAGARRAAELFSVEAMAEGYARRLGLSSAAR